MAKSISLFYLVAVALQTMCVASTAITRPYQASLTVDDDDIKANSLSNIYLDYGNRNIQGTLTLTFGDCAGDLDTPHTTIIGSADISDQVKPTKFVWATPGYTKSGCIFAIDDKGKVFAKSKRYTISPKISKRGHPELDDMHFDAVNFYKVRTANHGNMVAASDKSEKIGIVGAGMSGLFSALLLEQAGFHNYEILEANNRLGGRVHTTYFKGNTHSLHGDENSIAYQEMGPMRIPISMKYNNKTLPVTDNDILFHMANELNTLNNNDQKYKIDFVDWIQSTENNLYYKHGIRLPNGKVPTVGQVAADASLSTGNSSSTSASVAEEIAAKVDEATANIYNDGWFELMSKDLYAAHEKAIKEGFDDWSEWGWLHHKMGADLHISEYAANLHSRQIWHSLYEKFAKSMKDARTVQGGMTRLAKAYEPIIGHKVKFGVRVTKIDHEDGKVSVQWKNDPYDTKYNKKSFDNAIISVPFSIVRTWHLPELPYTLRSAIDNLGYSSACKVAMEFRTRFWEHYEIPIHGGCDTTDLYAGEICYPSNNITDEGPGVMLASYSGDDAGLRFASMTEKQHVARVLEDIVELHGDIAREQYTGNYDRVCWILDEFQSGAWASPEPGQHKLYMPSYFEINNGIVFVGEHTDIKHGWISAALESAIRGVVMVLIEHGHVKEAKALVQKWDAKWLKI